MSMYGFDNLVNRMSKRRFEKSCAYQLTRSESISIFPMLLKIKTTEKMCFYDLTFSEICMAHIFKFYHQQAFDKIKTSEPYFCSESLVDILYFDYNFGLWKCYCLNETHLIIFLQYLYSQHVYDIHRCSSQFYHKLPWYKRNFLYTLGVQ